MAAARFMDVPDTMAHHPWVERDRVSTVAPRTNTVRRRTRAIARRTRTELHAIFALR
jgi:hypothetical protein